MLRKFLPNLAIVAALIYVVMFVINCYNDAMGFLKSDFTVCAVLVLCVSSVINSCRMLASERRRDKRRRARRCQD